jgi:hypothetical protein
MSTVSPADLERIARLAPRGRLMALCGLAVACSILEDEEGLLLIADAVPRAALPPFYEVVMRRLELPDMDDVVGAAGFCFHFALANKVEHAIAMLEPFPPTQARDRQAAPRRLAA